ncbi:type VI secretion system baseplate subunit TssF, partial [Pseudomonas sp. SIMBA_068]
KQSLSQSQHIPKGSRLCSEPVDGVACEFRTCTAVNIHPFKIDTVSATQTLDNAVIRIGLQALVDRPLNSLGCSSLDFYLSGDIR